MKLKNTMFEDGKIGAINELIKQPLPAFESYKLAKLAKELKEKEEVYRTAKIAVFKKYGKEKKDGSLEIKRKNQKVALEELNEILAIEEEYSLEGKIVLPKDIVLSALQLMLLEEIVEVES